jgi:hypothetical protein
MPIEYTVSEDGTFVHTVCTGFPSPNDLIRHEESLLVDDRIRKPGFKELFDASGIQGTDVEKDTVEKVAQIVLSNPGKLTASKVAIVVGDQATYQKARYYEKLIGSLETIIVFNDASIAKIWLDVADAVPAKKA